MNYEQLESDIVKWLKDYYYMYALDSFVVGVSGGIDSAVVSTLCAKTGLPTYVMTMPLHSKEENTELSELHAYGLVEKYSNVTLVNVDLSETYDKFMLNVDDTFTSNELSNAISVMGTHLATLSEKFVEDYNPLTDRLREVVRISRGV